MPAANSDSLDAPILAEHGVVAGASVPMLVSDRRIGLIGVYWRSARNISTDERRLLALVANQTSLAVAQLPGR